MSQNESNIQFSDSKMSQIYNLKNKGYNYICLKCGKKYSKNSNLRRHEKTCKINNQNNLLKYINKQNEKLHRQNIEIEKMKKRHEKLINNLLNKVGSKTINNTNNIENQQINIHINNYGKENLDYITDDFLVQILKGPFGAVQKLIKHIHFNPKHPENCNIKITNKKLPYAKVYINNDWIIKDTKKLIKNMVDDRYNMIDSEFDKQENKLSETQKKRYINFQKKYDNRDKKLIKELNKDIEIEILNNKTE